MQFCDPNQRLRCSARGAPSLLPLLQGTLRDSEQGGKLRLCQAGFQTRPHDGRTGLSRSPFATASLDFTHAVQDLLPDVAVRLESGERTSGEFLSHVGTPPSVVSEYGPARSPAWPWHTMPASRTRSAESARNKTTRSPPRLPAPSRRQRSFLTPPEPRTIAPASGFCIMNCCNSPYSSSSR